MTRRRLLIGFVPNLPPVLSGNVWRRPRACCCSLVLLVPHSLRRWQFKLLAVASGSTAAGPGAPTKSGQGSERREALQTGTHGRHEDDDPLSVIVMLPIQADRTASLSSSLLTTTRLQANLRVLYLAHPQLPGLRQATLAVPPEFLHGCVSTAFSTRPGNPSAPIITVARFARQPSAVVGS